MTMNAAETYPREPPSAVPEPDGLTLVGEHALLLRGVHRRVSPVLALIDAGAWPTAELHTLVDFLRASLLRQASDEEALLFPGGAATPFAELTAQHAGLHLLTERLAQANMAHCPPRELRRMIAELADVLARHVEMEEALLAGLTETSHPVPSAAELSSGARTWLAATDAPLLIVLDDLPGDAPQLCIERLLRLRPGQRAEIRSSNRDCLNHVYRWMRAFDPVNYGIEYPSATDPDDVRLQVTRRRTG